MGCRQPQMWPKSPENEKLMKFEETLGFGRYDSEFYEGIIARLGKSLSFGEFVEGFQKFSGIVVSDSLKDQLSYHFSIDNQINLKAFKCFCIIQSKSPLLEKGESFWYTFDTNLNSHLANSDIQQMLTYLLTTSVSISLSLAQKSADPDCKNLSIYEKILKDRVFNLNTKLLKHFTQSKERITKEEFLLRLQDRPEGFIYTTSELRAQLEVNVLGPLNHLIDGKDAYYKD